MEFPTKAEVVIHHFVHILQVILLHQASYVHLCSLIGQWSRVSAVSMASAIELARAKMQQLTDAINRLFFVLRWIQSHGEIVLLYYAEDLTVFICRRHWFGPARCRGIDDVPIQDCYSWFDHSPHNLHRFHRLLRILESFVRPSRKVHGGEECFLVYLYHLTKGMQFTEMA